MCIIQFCLDQMSGKNKRHNQNVLNLLPAVNMYIFSSGDVAKIDTSSLKKVPGFGFDYGSGRGMYSR